MGKYILYPPQEIGRKLTAKSVCESLGEHFSAFLVANNISGWSECDSYILRGDRISDLLIMISCCTGLYVGQVKFQARRVRELAKASGVNLRLCDTYQMLARALGYRSYHDAYKCRSVDDFIESIWPEGAAVGLNTMELEVRGCGADSKLISHLKERYRYNMIRDKVFSPKAQREATSKKELLRIKECRREARLKQQRYATKPIEYS
ncbi:hypothetical protein PS673_02021 [Pseudomonas fluorescens]|uniref:Uncharacterized protein n=1 Tax=Pseudomonas fluorescens TaxID=294 RepID=A0A5E6S5B4_PSEFL|nr:hypothetical protein [Pseudomonas fluorescens]VVM75927.1 hypothetical protein PS673_02021 [Pseudomonas fluorescens]